MPSMHQVSNAASNVSASEWPRHIGPGQAAVAERWAKKRMLKPLYAAKISMLK